MNDAEGKLDRLRGKRSGCVAGEGINVRAVDAQGRIRSLAATAHALSRPATAGLVTRERSGLVLHGTAAHHIACLVERAEEGTG